MQSENTNNNDELSPTPYRSTVTYAIAMLLCLMTPSTFFLLAERDLSQDSTETPLTNLPHITLVSGTVQNVTTGMCERSTRTSQGTQLTITSDDGKTLNLHLGAPGVKQVRQVAGDIKPGTRITADIFRTQNLAVSHFIVKSIQVGTTQYDLRDSDLRPYWSGKSFKRNTRGFCG